MTHMKQRTQKKRRTDHGIDRRQEKLPSEQLPVRKKKMRKTVANQTNKMERL